MKLAEALQERADINHNIEQLKNRLNNNVLVQDGETTVEDPNKLKTELDNSIKRLQYLIARINQTNCETSIDGESITEIIAQKDALSLKINIYKETAFLASQLSYRARPLFLLRTGSLKLIKCLRNFVFWIINYRRITGKQS